MRQYTEITEPQIRKFFSDINILKQRRIWKQISPPHTKEIVYAATINSQFELRIYTTVHVDTDTSRTVGKDAIRIHIYDIINNGIVKAANRTNRNGDILQKVKEKALEIWKGFKPTYYKCECGGTFLIKKGKFGEFLGCSNYKTGCKKTKQFPSY